MMFADDITLCGGTEVDMTKYLETWRKARYERRIRVSRPKTQFMDFKFERNEEVDKPTVKIQGDELEKVTHLKYLGSVVEEKLGGTEIEIKQRVGAACRNGKKCSRVLCNKKMQGKFKGYIYKKKTVVRPALIYRAETSAATEGQEARMMR